ncbi:MAG: hypothetical protein ACR2QK_06385 [Acidimicrobiales bacterium]
MMINPRQTIWRLLAVVIVPLGFLLFAAPIGAQTEVEQPVSAPDIALLVSDIDDDQRARLIDRLEAIDGVGRASADPVGGRETVLYLTGSGPGEGNRPVDAVVGEAERLVADLAPEAGLLVGGAALVDDALDDRFDTTVLALVLLAAVAGAASGVIFGLKRGLLTGAAMALTVYCAGNIGSQVGGDFDGTISTTALPGALAGLVVAATLSVRLLIWYRRPVGVDGADMIRHSILELVPELALVFSGLFVSAVLVELLDPGRSPLTVVAISGVVAAIVLLAVLAPGLTILIDEPEERTGWLPASFPDGRDLPLLILVAVAMVPVALSLFAFGQPARPLLDADQLATDSEPAIVAARLKVAGGDATNALVATKSAETAQADFDGWAEVIVERSVVERVDTASGRYLPTGRIDIDETASLVPPGSEGAAVIVLNVSPRSEVGQDVTSRLAAMPLAGGQPRITGDAADAAGVAGSRTAIIVAVVTLALAAATGVHVLTQNAAQSAVAFLLRLIGGGASVGVYRLMVVDATMAESLTVLATLGLGVGLYELEFIQRPVPVGEPGAARRGVEANPGQFAAFGLVLLGLGGLVVAVAVLFGGGPSTGRFGLGLLAAVVVELLTGIVLLRPALLGQRAAFHTAVRPVRIALHSGNERQSEATLGPEDPTWRRVVGDLLQAEFRLQSQPGDADLDSVFVRDTPLFRQATTHHGNLADAGLRIVGRSPRLRSLKTVSGRSPITLAVTVDHPERHLVDGTGSVVGVRKPERRSGVLWLSDDGDGSFRIAESVELGSVPLPGESEGSGGEEWEVGSDDEASPVDHRLTP